MLYHLQNSRVKMMVVLRHITNPIEWQETHHQQRQSVSTIRRRWRFISPLTLAATILLVAFTLRDVSGPTRELGMLVVWMIHALTAVRAIAAGANSISREYDGQTWIPLILTGVSTRQILFGKWLGVMHQIAPWMLTLGTVRLLMLPIFMLSFANRFAWRLAYRNNTPGYYYNLVDAIGWVEWAAVTAVIMTVVLTVLEIMCCAAIGLAASAVIKRGWLALIVAICIRFAPVVIFAAFTRYEVGMGPSWRVLRFTPLALADSGSAPLYQLSLPLTSWTINAHEDALPGIFLASLLLIVLLVGALWVAWAAIRAAGALPNPKPVPIIRRNTNQFLIDI
jgi:ABC-type transport system involved in multi-copper enzyme maturation permease subunit